MLSSLGRSPPSSVGSLQRLPEPSSLSVSAGSSLPRAPGPSSPASLPANLPGTLRSSSSSVILPSDQALGEGLPQLQSVQSPSSTSVSALDTSSFPSRSSLLQFKAPAPSPPTSHQTLSTSTNVNTNLSRTPGSSNIEKSGGKAADISTSQKIVPRFKFQAPTKKQISDDSMFYESQKSAVVSTQESPSEEVEDLLEGLDEDSIFGDF